MIIRILMFPVMLLIVLYCVIALIMPTMKEITAEKDTIEQKMTERDGAQQRLDKVKTIVASVNSHDAERGFVMNFLPTDQQEEILLSDVSQLATKSGVSLFSMGFAEGRSDVRSAASSDGRPYLIEGKMIASGSYENFEKFIAELFHLKRLYAFKTIELTKGEQEKKEGETAPQPQVLSGVISFAYGFIPGQVHIGPNQVQRDVDYDVINTIMRSSAQTNPLKAEPQNRVNPFLP